MKQLIVIFVPPIFLLKSEEALEYEPESGIEHMKWSNMFENIVIYVIHYIIVDNRFKTQKRTEARY